MKAATFVLICLSVAAMQRPAPSRQTPTVRFHHVHYRVSDPGAALAPAVAALRGTRALLPGLGVGVRIGRQYLLFDREEAATQQSRTADVADVRQWLAARGLDVADEEAVTVAAALPADAVLDHVAFATSDLDAVVAAIKLAPTSRTEYAARFTLASGGVFEIVRDTVGPDTHWCPMHPDVRRPGADKCPRCGMALVPIPPTSPGEYRMDVSMMPRRNGGAAGLRLVIREPTSGQPVQTFIDVHERPLHLFIVSKDLETFAHVHPERRANGTFTISHELSPGAYGVMADFLPAAGTSQLLQRVIVTPGYKGSLFSVPQLSPSPLDQTLAGLRIALDRPNARARRSSVLRFHVSDASTKQPISDLEPYLGAAAHLIVVSPDLTTAFHAHPEGDTTSGPEVVFDPTFPTPGLYKMWVQFQRKGQIVTAPFVVSVEP